MRIPLHIHLRKFKETKRLYNRISTGVERRILKAFDLGLIIFLIFRLKLVMGIINDFDIRMNDTDMRKRKDANFRILLN